MMSNHYKQRDVLLPLSVNSEHKPTVNLGATSGSSSERRVKYVQIYVQERGKSTHGQDNSKVKTEVSIMKRLSANRPASFTIFRIYD